ncbi:MAG TPA: hypothetical protein PK395_01230, partial [bacterium]|nr:hypothetical protein [bacterium]
MCCTRYLPIVAVIAAFVVSAVHVATSNDKVANTEADAGFCVPLAQRQLFLDDYGIAKIDNLERTMHKPIKKGTIIRPTYPLETSLQTRSAPAWDPSEKVYKLWLLVSRIE